MQRFVISILLGVLLLVISGCWGDVEQSHSSISDTDAKIAVISLTSDPLTDPQAVNMGLTFAGFCLDEGYEVAIFFNVKGVSLPTTSFDAAYKYLEHAPMLEQLQTLADRGAELHVCPVCMKDLNITAENIVENAFVTDKAKLFGKLGGDTMIFTY